MAFQLVRAGDTEIAVWNVEHGHIFVFQIPERADALLPGPIRDVPNAAERAEGLQAEALSFATHEARKRRLLG